MVLKKYKLIVLSTVLLVLFSMIAFATCTVEFNKEEYAPSGTVTATMICTGNEEQSRAYTLNWTNQSGHVFELDTGITPAAKNTYFYETYTIVSTWPDGVTINASLIGANLEGSDYANVTTAAGVLSGVLPLLVTNISISSEYYLGRHGAITFYVKGIGGDSIANSQCLIDIVDGNNLPVIAHEEPIIIQGNGKGFYSNYLDETLFEENQQFKWDIVCHCINASEGYSGNPGFCYNISNGLSIKNFGYANAQYPFTISDVTDKLNWSTRVNSSHPGLWVENELGYRVFMKDNPSLAYQEDIDWPSYNNTIDGEGFLTAGEKFRICSIFNNTFDDIVHLTMYEPSLVRIPAHEVIPYYSDGSLIIDGEEIMHLPIRPYDYQNLSYEKCTDWLILPLNIKGQNKYKFHAHLYVDGYNQEILLESERFTIFGEKRNETYPDFLTINNVEFTYDNATEGEHIQLKINVTNNHPTKEIDSVIHIELESNYGGNTRKIRPTPYNLDNWGITENYFHYSKRIMPNTTNVILTPRFIVPYGLRDIDDYPVISADVLIGVLNSLHGEIVYSQSFEGQQPTIAIIANDLNVTGINITIYNTSASACSAYTVTLGYDNEVSHTNATADENEHMVVRGCIEDTTNDIYIYCTTFEVQPDEGFNKQGNYTDYLPYVTSNIEAEIDIWMYSFDAANLDKDCYHCGELIDFISGDDGRATFNITVNNNDSCRYLKYGITGEDDGLYLQYLQHYDLADIANKTGTFKMEIACPATARIGSHITCNITAQIEDTQAVQKEVDFNCHLSDKYGNQYSPLNFNQMINRSAITLEKSFFLPNHYVDGAQYTVDCAANYYNFGSRSDTFSDSFIALSDDNSGSAVSAITRALELPTEIFKKYKGPSLFCLVLAIIFCCLYYENKKKNEKA